MIEVARKKVFVTLIKEEAQKVQTGGLVLDGQVTAVSKKPTTALIAHVGKDIEGYKTGDRVYIGQFYSDEQEVEGVKYVIMKEDDILAKL